MMVWRRFCASAAGGEREARGDERSESAFARAEAKMLDVTIDIPICQSQIE